MSTIATPDPPGADDDGLGPWQPELEELARRRAFAARMGGAEKVERHHANGKLTVRERIDALLDPGSFREVGELTGRAIRDDDGTLTDVMPANFVMGRGRIDGRPSWSAATTSRCEAARPTPRSSRSR